MGRRAKAQRAYPDRRSSVLRRTTGQPDIDILPAVTTIGGAKNTPTTRQRGRSGNWPYQPGLSTHGPWFWSIWCQSRSPAARCLPAATLLLDCWIERPRNRCQQINSQTAGPSPGKDRHAGLSAIVVPMGHSVVNRLPAGAITCPPEDTPVGARK